MYQWAYIDCNPARSHKSPLIVKGRIKKGSTPYVEENMPAESLSATLMSDAELGDRSRSEKERGNFDELDLHTSILDLTHCSICHVRVTLFNECYKHVTMSHRQQAILRVKVGCCPPATTVRPALLEHVRYKNARIPRARIKMQARFRIET